MKIEGNWKQLRGKLKEKYGQLTDDDLKLAEGETDQLVGRLQKKLGKTREAISQEISEMV
ncbi:MAG: CsbD family protein [Saprospiraceae bacterium]|nr:CsbD family protein [Saprospiraceae bacterium]